ncbi:Riboflavin synthase [Buchnera aphidicola (Eriosoma grossulariae)]|uniref:riboflavin synthase subunit alpha n=1 Tax=Buchnera aphidicola TaxID=9 RepID=UPI003463AEBD
MFTGIIDGIAKVVLIKRKNNFLSFVIQIPCNLLLNLKLGASVSNNGCCLSITSISGDYIGFDVISETLRCSNLSFLKLGDFVNIERSKKFSDEIGGHILSGHISTVAECLDIVDLDFNSQLVYCKLRDLYLMKYIFHKGFISIDGISLTVGNINKDVFCFYLIPDTLLKTTMKQKTKGSIFNIEIDYSTQVIVDTVEKIMHHQSYSKLI